MFDIILNADIDECLSLVLNICEQTCQNTAGSYTCGCESGYTKWNSTHCKGISKTDFRIHARIVNKFVLSHYVIRLSIMLVIKDCYHRQRNLSRQIVIASKL